MADFNIRPDSVSVEQIMQQIRARIREKQGVGYTEQQIRDLAAEAFERFLDPRQARPGLLDQYRQGRVPPVENYAFEDTTLFESHRAPLRWLRRLLRPMLKLFFNPNPLIHALHLQSGINARHAESAAISYDLLYRLVQELTRLEVELKALAMRVESTTARLEFAERRARSLEGRGQRRPDEAPAAPAARAKGSRAPAAQAAPWPPAAGQDAEQADGAEARRKRRRRRGRRAGAGRLPADPEPSGADAKADSEGPSTAAGAPADGERQPAAKTASNDPGGRTDASSAPSSSDREEP